MTSAATSSSSGAPASRLSTRDFDRIFRDPERRQRSARFLLLARRRTGSGLRWGISIKARLGHAVLRNRIRRRVREGLRRLAPKQPGGWDLVVQPRSPAVATADFASLSRELEELLAKALGAEQEP